MLPVTCEQYSQAELDDEREVAADELLAADIAALTRADGSLTLAEVCELAVSVGWEHVQTMKLRRGETLLMRHPNAPAVALYPSVHTEPAA